MLDILLTLSICLTLRLPINVYLPSILATAGPPESPWQASGPPRCKSPAQNIPLLTLRLPYTYFKIGSSIDYKNKDIALNIWITCNFSRIYEYLNTVSFLQSDWCIKGTTAIWSFDGEWLLNVFLFLSSPPIFLNFPQPVISTDVAGIDRKLCIKNVKVINWMANHYYT